jgi:tripeptidyl-peptidase-1
MNGLLSLKLALLSLCALARASFVLHDSRGAPPSGFVHQGAAPADETITFRVGLTSSDVAGLEAKLQTISNPASSEYGQWLSAGGHVFVLDEVGC